jgi:hypothetical protein
MPFQQEIPEQGDVVVPGDGVAAFRASGGGEDDGTSFRNPVDTNIEKAPHHGTEDEDPQIDPDHTPSIERLTGAETLPAQRRISVSFSYMNVGKGSIPNVPLTKASHSLR